VRPDLTTRIGLVRVTRRAIRKKRRGLPKLSRYIRIARVRGSCSQYSSRSLPETSALLPSDANIDSPSPISRIEASTASPSAPDCDENAMLPASGSVAANDACSRTAGSVLMIPMPFGPMIRMPCSRARSRISRSAAAPASPTSLKPEVTMTRPRTPFRAQLSTTPRTSAFGTAITARSIASGIASTSG